MDVQYVVGYQLLSACSDEERAIYDSIICSIKKFDYFMDIGSADGRMTEAFGSHFAFIHFYEPNPIFYSLALARLKHLGRHISGNRGIFDRTDGNYDFILASHVLYHIPLDEWRATFRNIRTMLSDEGILAVVLWDKDSAARQISLEINSSRWLCSSENLIELNWMLYDEGLILEKHAQLRPVIEPETEEAAALILDFLTGRERVETPNSTRRKIIDKLVDRTVDNKQSIMIYRVR